MGNRLIVLLLSCLLALCGSCPSGKRILVVGDSPIFFGGSSPYGFFRLIEKILRAECPDVTIDIEAQRNWVSEDILANFDTMLSTHKPTDILLLTGTLDTHRIVERAKLVEDVRASHDGVNFGLSDGRVVQRFDDVATEENEGEYPPDIGVDPEEMAKFIAEFHNTVQHIVARALAANVGVTIGSPLVYGERVNGNEHDDAFEDVTGALLHIVVDFDLKYVDIRSELLKEIEVRSGRTPLDDLNHNILTYDGVHMNEVGHQILRDCLLTGVFSIFSQSAGYVHQKSDSSLTGSHLCMHNERFVDEFEQRRNGIIKRSDTRKDRLKRESLLTAHDEMKRLELEGEIKRLKKERRQQREQTMSDALLDVVRGQQEEQVVYPSGMMAEL